ncbi:hypothetical protein FFF34_016580 [Inquilinus sp. KBS0705]|nr:hypothetical protein FFF34_016580 [Inquilinus sp. KBS0705]
MKKALLLVAIVCSFAACKKDKPATTNSVFGKWELRAIQSNLPNPTIQPAGNGDIYVFKSDSSYVRYLDNKIKSQGKFSIKITEVRDTIKGGTIYLTNPTYTDAFQIRPTTIVIGSSAADGPSYYYKKIK